MKDKTDIYFFIIFILGCVLYVVGGLYEDDNDKQKELEKLKIENLRLEIELLKQQLNGTTERTM